MLEQIAPLWECYLNNKQNNLPLVLATLVKTTGSSYKKAGAMMLIEQNLTTHGLLSGGCLEADVAEHATQVFDSAQAMVLNYDLSDESIFGLGAGCDGTIQIVLQLLTDNYLPFSALNPMPQLSQAVKLYINADETGPFPIGSYYLSKNNEFTEHPTGFSQQVTTAYPVLQYSPPPRIAICGAGIDVIPVLQLLHLLSWHVYLVDHSRARLDQLAECPDTHKITASADDLPVTLSNQEFDAVVIMSHSLDRDSAFLKYFFTTKTPWIGLLGPTQRRDKVLQKANINLAQIQTRLRSPIGLDIGGRMPENIAVSIVAQLQAYFYQT